MELELREAIKAAAAKCDEIGGVPHGFARSSDYLWAGQRATAEQFAALKEADAKAERERHEAWESILNAALPKILIALMDRATQDTPVSPDVLLFLSKMVREAE